MEMQSLPYPLNFAESTFLSFHQLLGDHTDMNALLNLPTPKPQKR